MNDGITISTAQLLRMFLDEEAARHYIESRRWPNGPRCPICGLGDRVGIHSPGLYRCGQCKEAFSVRTGTIMERSKIPLTKWIHAMYLLVTERKGISSVQLSKELSIRQASAWFLLQRLRGIVELDALLAAGVGRRITYAELIR